MSAGSASSAERDVVFGSRMVGAMVRKGVPYWAPRRRRYRHQFQLDPHRRFTGRVSDQSLAHIRGQGEIVA